MNSADQIQADVRANIELGLQGDSWDNYAVARNILQEDLGWASPDKARTVYELSEATRNRLIAHARQDAAHALCNTVSILKASASIKRGLVLANVLLLAVVALLIWKVI